MPDVIIIGAGVIGSACALRLAQAGLSVTLLERDAPASGASRAALGLLQFHYQSDLPDAYNHLAFRAHALFPPLIEELAAAAGAPVAYQAGGQLSFALSEPELAELHVLYAANAERALPAERLSAAGCLALEPAIHPGVLGGLLLPRNAWVDNTALSLALAQAAQSAGARLLPAAAEAVVSSHGRVTGVRASGQIHSADWVVLAAGCWSGQIAGVPPLPIRPIRGQALLVAGQPVSRIIAAAHGYLVPKGDDQTLIGATVEDAGFDAANTLAGLAEIMAAAAQIVPALAGGRFLRAWAGLRPGTPDGLPYIGPFAAVRGLLAATGHFRNGILQAPATAEIVHAHITGALQLTDLAAFSPDRAALA